MLRFFHCLALVVVSVVLSGCCPCVQPNAATRPVISVSPAVPASLPVGPQAGDILNVVIEGQDDLSGRYTVGPDGNITMPLAGKIAVAGQPNSALAGVIGDAYRAGYLVDPKVSVEVQSK